VTRTLTVALGERSYPIHVGSHLLREIGALLPRPHPRRAVVVTNATVAQFHLETLRAGLSAAGIRHDEVVVPDGEEHKNWETLYRIHTRLIELGAERATLMIALGGGVVGDLAGFAAATYQRGMPLVQIPTTLLAQVDSSVGGKTAVNHALGKNMIGAFHQPLAVLIDTSMLATLPTREYVAGIAEIIKYGAIRSPTLFEWLEESIDQLVAGNADAVTHAVVESCTIKAEIVAADEREAGERALLNFGHTFGHAIEAGAGYGTWLHGEAVAAGMLIAAELSVRCAGLPRADRDRLYALVARSGLPVRAPQLGAKRYLELMHRDKKVDAGALRLVLLSALGRAAVVRDVPAMELQRVLEAL